MQTTLISGPAAFTQLAAEWDALAATGMTDTPFQSLAYQRAWWIHLQPETGDLHTVAVRSDDGDLRAIASFYLLDGLLYFNGCVEETDYLDLIVRAEEAEAAWQAVWRCLNSDGFPHWQGMSLCNVPAGSPSRTILARLANEAGYDFAEEIHEVCPVITLPDSFDAYLDSLDSKQRREINRKLRRADAAGATLRVIGSEDDLDTAVDDFLDLLQKSTFEKREWLNEGRRAVFHDTARAALDAGTLQLMFIELRDQKAAALFNFDYRDRVWVYNSGLDPRAFGKLSLGVVLTAKAIELAIENGRRDFDFLRGNETYKYRFGAEDTRIYRLQVTR